MSKVKKCDIYFLGAMFAVLCIHLIFSFLPHFLPDEPFYATIPYRLVNGDSLFQDEWHLSQIASFFSYIPVKFWLSVNGSADGLLIFLRLTYLVVHTAAAVVIYRLFRSYRIWAVITALLYYLQTPYKLYAISYNSMFALFLLLFSLCFYLMYRNHSKKLSFLAGIFYSACCVANPAFAVTICFFPVLYVCDRVGSAARRKTRISGAEGAPLLETCHPEDRGFLFTIPTAACFAAGILSVVAMGLLFFFGTKGTISSVLDNLPVMLKSSEYGVSAASFSWKMEMIGEAISNLTLNRPYWLPLLMVVMLLDPKRKENTHRLVYLLAVIPLSVLCILGMRFSPKIDHSLLQSFPVALLSVVCYILTEKKNKPLFRWMWCPCMVAALINLYISNTVLSAAGFVMAVGNVSGVLFVRDLFQEMTARKPDGKKSFAQRFSRAAICMTLVLQMVFYLYIVQFGQPFTHTAVCVSDGPYAGMVMEREDSESYYASLKDLDIIRERSNEEDPVLIVSYQSWMYLYLERPIATYTAWYDVGLDTQALRSYYRMNPKKIPQYVYVVYSDDIDSLGIHVQNMQFCETELNSLFSYTTEELANGLLLTITEYRANE